MIKEAEGVIITLEPQFQEPCELRPGHLSIEVAYLMLALPELGEAFAKLEPRPLRKRFWLTTHRNETQTSEEKKVPLDWGYYF